MKSAILFLANIFLLLLTSNGQIKYSKSLKTKDVEQKSVQTIRKIFSVYTQYEDGAASNEDKDAMKTAISSLPAIINKNELPLLINVWMYYDPTDFPTRDMLTPIFKRNKTISLIAIRNRIKSKKKWESKDTAPFSDLIELEKDLRLNG